MKSDTLKFIDVKGKNVRVSVHLLQNEKKDKVIVVASRRLVDFKTRQITVTANYYSIETAFFIKDALDKMLENSEVENKILLNEINKIHLGSAQTNLKQ